MTITQERTLSRIEDLEWMAETGVSRIDAARRLGLLPRTLDRYLWRQGRTDLLRTLSARDPLILLPNETKTIGARS